MGASGSISVVLQTAPQLFLWSLIAIATHMVLCLVFEWVWGYSRREMALASNANVGGKSALVGHCYCLHGAVALLLLLLMLMVMVQGCVGEAQGCGSKDGAKRRVRQCCKKSWVAAFGAPATSVWSWHRRTSWAAPGGQCCAKQPSN